MTQDCPWHSTHLGEDLPPEALGLGTRIWLNLPQQARQWGATLHSMQAPGHSQRAHTGSRGSSSVIVW